MTDLAQSMRFEIDRLRARHAAEVRDLRQRVQVLESALAQANETGEGSRLPTARDIASARRSDDPSASWGDHEITFEERVAAKAFFRDGSHDERSRRWLLGSR